MTSSRDHKSAFRAVGDSLRNLRKLTEKVTDAEFEALVENLSSQVSELQTRVADIAYYNTQLRTAISKLKQADEHELDPCPRCKKRCYRLESSSIDSEFGRVGWVLRKYICAACGFTEDKFCN
jgi:hypothetical protein